jgi:hypothetical protein
MSLRYISIYWTLLPVVTGLIFIRKLNFECRLILGLLIYGFITDMIVGNDNIYLPLRFFLWNFFHLIESLTLALFVNYFGKSMRIKSIGKYLIISLPIFWVFSHKELFLPGADAMKFSPVFSVVYNMIFAVLYGYLTIKFAEVTMNLFGSGMFWLLFALFLNCFCVFFVFSFLATSFVHDIWFVQSLLNMLVYSMVAVSFVMVSKNNMAITGGVH